MNEQDEAGPGLEAGFAALRARRAEVSSAFVARVLADAEAVQAARASAGARGKGGRIRARAARGWHALSVVVGGVRGVAGLATAAAAGLWIGIAPPAPLTALENALLATPYVLELDEDTDFVLDE